MTDQVQAFSTQQIVETRRGSLRSRAVLEVRAITPIGWIYVRSADDIRLIDEVVEVRDRLHQWTPVTELGIEAWASEERLNWRKPNGAIVRWDERPCHACNGTGYDWLTMAEMPGDTCEVCAGVGKININD